MERVGIEDTNQGCAKKAGEKNLRLEIIFLVLAFQMDDGIFNRIIQPFGQLKKKMNCGLHLELRPCQAGTAEEW